MIEDIQYLKENSQLDSAVVYIDSQQRNRRAFPTPETYSVSFDVPFKNVVGFDILDASIPTTMWNVDRYNGTLAITGIFSPSSVIDPTEKEIYFKEVKNAKSFSRLFERSHIVGSLNENFVLVMSKEQYDTFPINPATQVTPFFVYVREVIVDTDIKIAPANISEEGVYIFNYLNTRYYVQLDDPNIVYLETGNYALLLNENGGYNLVYFMEINVFETTNVSIKNAINYLIDIKNLYKQIELGNYDITSLKAELNNTWQVFDIKFESTAGTDRKQGIIKLTSSNGFIAINANIGRLIRQLGFDTLPTPSERHLYQECPVGDNPTVFAAISDSTYGIGYVVVAPGIINLLGDRYVILRCPEIEDHLLGSYAYIKSTPGLGLFKLAAAQNDVTHLRFDFVNLVRKPFHPIGKLAKLTFRFETQSGDLYDFKGVNHQILFVIKFLVPSQKHNFYKSILNPNYDANFIRYMSTSRTIENKEDSDEEEDYDTKGNIIKYKKEMQQYDYSSSDDGDNTDNSEVEFDFTTKNKY
jgi:hypothetical protein